VVKAWVSLGAPLDKYAGIGVPVLDLYGDNDQPEVLTNAKKRKDSLKAAGSKQQVVPHADHFYSGHEAEMVAAVADYLNAILK